MGGYRVQARTAEAALQLQADAHALADAGAGAIVLEGVPREAAARITAALPIPTIGIGAGPDCDGQILVFHDLVNLTFAPPPNLSAATRTLPRSSAPPSSTIAKTWSIARFRPTRRAITCPRSRAKVVAIDGLPRPISIRRCGGESRRTRGIERANEIAA